MATEIRSAPFQVKVEEINRYIHDIADRTDDQVLSFRYGGMGRPEITLIAVVQGDVLTARRLWLEDALAELWPQVVSRRPHVGNSG